MKHTKETGALRCVTSIACNDVLMRLLVVGRLIYNGEGRKKTMAQDVIIRPCSMDYTSYFILHKTCKERKTLIRCILLYIYIVIK